MSIEFTEYDDGLNIEVYSSTNKYLRFALERLDHEYIPCDIFWKDNLLPIELKSLGYKPADKLMNKLMDDFFYVQSDRGLIQANAFIDGMKWFNGNVLENGCHKWVPRSGDSSMRNRGVLGGNSASTVKMLNRMYEFLTWFSPDQLLKKDGEDDLSLLGACKKWADGFQEGQSDHEYGHNAGYWKLFDFVQAGPKREENPKIDPWNPLNWKQLKNICESYYFLCKHLHNINKDIEDHYIRDLALKDDIKAQMDTLCTNLREFFDQYFIRAYEGFPDSCFVTAGDYGIAALAYVSLGNVIRDKAIQIENEQEADLVREGAQIYENFAKGISLALWYTRLCSDTYLMPYNLTTWGPLPGDPDVPFDGIWLTGTDCLYWALNLFKAYRLVGKVRHDLSPKSGFIPDIGRFRIPSLDTWFANLKLQKKVKARRVLLDDLLLDDLLPDRLLSDGYTIDDSALNQMRIEHLLAMALGLTLDWIKFGWKPELGHFASQISHDGKYSTKVITDDGKYNTLAMLIEAYRVTHDKFYLSIFDQAWSKFEKLAQDYGGFFPYMVVKGKVDDNPNHPLVDSGQVGFIDIMIEAYLVTKEAREPRSEYLDKAIELADRFLALGVKGRSEMGISEGDGSTFLKLANAIGKLRRIQFVIKPKLVKLEIHCNSMIHQNCSCVDCTVARSDSLPLTRAVIYMDPGNYIMNIDNHTSQFKISDRTSKVDILDNYECLVQGD